MWGEKVAVTLSLLNSVQLPLVYLLFRCVCSIYYYYCCLLSMMITYEPTENLRSGAFCTAAVVEEGEEGQEEEGERSMIIFKSLKNKNIKKTNQE